MPILFMLVLLLAGCETLPPMPQAETVVAATPTPTPKPAATPISTKITTIKATVTGGTEKQRARLLRIAKEVEPIINSEKFKTRVLGAMYKGKLQFAGTSSTNKQVFDKFMAGDELKKGKPDKSWQLQMKITVLQKGRLGEMTWGKLELRFNSMYLDGRKDSGLAGTLCHEYAHLLGFTHDPKPNSVTPYSVPYAVGTICAELYLKR